MKKILIPVSIIAVLLCTAAKDADQTVISPDRLFLADNGKSLFVTNRAGSELIKMSADGKEMEQKVEFSSPVNAMTQDPDGNLWVVCDGNYGMMYQLDGKKLSIQSKTKSGATPSDILYNPLSQSLWVAQRFNNELWEIDPATRKVKAKITVGREPVAMASFAGDSCLLIANNMPEMPSTAYPLAAQARYRRCVFKEGGKPYHASQRFYRCEIDSGRQESCVCVCHSLDCPLSVAYQSLGSRMDGYEYVVHYRSEGEKAC